MKGSYAAFCLCVCLLALFCLLAGCGAEPDASSKASDGSSGSAASVAISAPSEPSVLSEPAISGGEPADSGSEDIPLIFGEVCEVFPGLRFRLPDGWEENAASTPETLFYASSAAGSDSVSAAYAALEQTTGLTEALLAAEFADTLPPLWEEAGAKDVKTDVTRLDLLGEEHGALSLTASVDGKAVYQLQVYLLRSDGLYTLTVTAGSRETANELLSAFEAE